MRAFDKRLFLVVIVITMSLIFSSCATKEKFLNSTVVPAAEGRVIIKKDKNNNYHVNVSVNNLADPGKLQPPKEVYIIWMETEMQATKNLGRIKTSKGMLSSGLKASFETVSTLRPKKIFISAEASAEVPEPSLIVLTTGDFY